jgi:CrcB protein
MPTWLAVAAGGAAGTLARYVIGMVWARPGAFPWWTLGVNVTGSLALGLIAGAAAARGAANSTLVLALTVGVAGGFTTFSTFSVETLALIDRGESLRAAAYVTASIVLGLLAAALGLYLTRSRIVA